VTDLRVLTYNILLGGSHRPVPEVVRAVAPHVLLVNESPKTPLRWRRRCRRLAARCGLRYVDGGRSAGSNMLAVADGVGVKFSSAERLPQPAWQPRRGVVAAQLRIEGRLVGVVGCHLSLDRDRRLGEVRRVLEVADTLRGPVVLAGDLNERPGGPSWQRLAAAGFVDHGGGDWPTFPADDPQRRIDALLVRGDVTVTHVGDPGVDPALLAEASDHRPVLGVLELSCQGVTRL
jgi:endonuclease/exonuclease/phosphatase family metal-dependent hydrolase